jgi:hypothetical protein
MSAALGMFLGGLGLVLVSLFTWCQGESRGPDGDGLSLLAVFLLFLAIVFFLISLLRAFAP